MPGLFGVRCCREIYTTNIAINDLLTILFLIIFRERKTGMESGSQIYLTNNQKTIEQCARMMAETDPWVKLGIDYEKCLVAFEGPCKEIYEVQVDGGLAGFVILQICGSFKGYIQTICIKPTYRGRGLGTRILQFCQERILKISPNIFICVSSFNTSALRLYQSFGFKLIGELENFVKEGYSELLLRKTFGPTSGYKTS